MIGALVILGAIVVWFLWQAFATEHHVRREFDLDAAYGAGFREGYERGRQHEREERTRLDRLIEG